MSDKTAMPFDLGDLKGGRILSFVQDDTAYSLNLDAKWLQVLPSKAGKVLLVKNFGPDDRLELSHGDARKLAEALSC